MNAEINAISDSLIRWLNSEQSIISVCLSVMLFLTQFFVYTFVKWLRSPATPPELSRLGRRLVKLLIEQPHTWTNGSNHLKHVQSSTLVYPNRDCCYYIGSLDITRQFNRGEKKLINKLAKALFKQNEERATKNKLNEARMKLDDAIYRPFCGDENPPMENTVDYKAPSDEDVIYL